LGEHASRYIAIVEDETFLIEVSEAGKVKVDGQTHTVDMQNIDGLSLFSLLVDNSSHEVFVEEREEEYRVLLKGELYTIRVEDERHHRLSKVRRDEEGQKREEVTIRAPMSGLVVSVPVESGQAVSAGEAIVILESMKMENELLAPEDGVIRAILVSPGDKVAQGQILVVVD